MTLNYDTATDAEITAAVQARADAAPAGQIDAVTLVALEVRGLFQRLDNAPGYYDEPFEPADDEALTALLESE